MKPMLAIATIGIAIMMSTGCATVEMVNTSPVQDVPEVSGFEAIPATLTVTSKDATRNDVVAKLLEHKFATEVVAAGQAGDLTLDVASEGVSNGHFGVEICLAVVRGLLLGLANGAFADKHDYEVTLTATLNRGDKLIKTYETVGSYHSECPESSDINFKVKHVQKNVLASWDHALELLVSEMKEDRADIISAIRAE